MFNIIEKFLSIDGEGKTSGELATFIRFQGCNLRCSWCDTTYSFSENEIREKLTSKEIYDYIKSNKVPNVTLTGGEPLIQENIDELLEILNEDKQIEVHIETNGSVNIKKFIDKYPNLIYILDYKLQSSNMTSKMCKENLKLARKQDVYKFVIASEDDLNEAYRIISINDIKAKIFFSPVSENIETQKIVEFMKKKLLYNVRLQIQLHKIVWNKNRRGV